MMSKEEALKELQDTESCYLIAPLYVRAAIRFLQGKEVCIMTINECISEFSYTYTENRGHKWYREESIFYYNVAKLLTSIANKND